MRYNFTVCSTICLLLAAMSGGAFADEHEVRWYDVEVVIFENIDVPRSSNTYWEKQAYIPIAENLKRDTSTKLPQESYRLAAEAASIRKSSRYKLLAHRAWRQKGAPLEESRPVRIRRGKEMPVFAPTEYLQPDVTEPLETDIADIRTTPRPAIPVVENFRPVFLNTYDQQFATYAQTLAYPLDGTVTVALGRYLHVYTDLALTKPSLAGGGALQTYFFKAHRRMRSRKLHYIDHPKMGMLVLITPYEPEDDS